MWWVHRSTSAPRANVLFVFIILHRCFFTLGYIPLWLYFVCMVINMHSFFLYFFVTAKWLELNAPLSKSVGLLLTVDSINVQIDLTLNNVCSVMQCLCDFWSHLCRNTDNRSLNSKPVTLSHESSHLCAPFLPKPKWVFLELRIPPDTDTDLLLCTTCEKGQPWKMPEPHSLVIAQSSCLEQLWKRWTNRTENRESS